MFRFIKPTVKAQISDNEVLWGLRIDRRVKEACQYVAGRVGVPSGLLVSFIVATWLSSAREAIYQKDLLKLLAIIVKAYGGELNDKQVHPERRPEKIEPAKFYPTVNWTIRNVSIDTRLALKTLALNRGITVSRLIEDMVARESERSEKGNEVLVPGLSAKVKREADKLLKLLDVQSRMDANEQITPEDIHRWLATDKDPHGLQKEFRAQGFKEEDIAKVRMKLSRELGVRI